MSVTDTRVVPFPHTFKPNIAQCFEFIDKAEGDGGYLVQLAQIGIQAAESNKSKIIAGAEPGRHLRPMVDGLGLAFFALGTLLGIPRGALDEVDLGPAPAVAPSVGRASAEMPETPVVEMVETFHEVGKGAKVLQPSRTTDKIGAFAGVKRALSRQKRDLARARRRRSALIPTREIAPTFWGEPMHLLKAVFDHAEVIAIDKKPKPKTVHLLVNMPTELLDRIFTITGIGEDDEEGGDAEPSGNDNKSADEEPSIASPGALERDRV